MLWIYNQDDFVLLFLFLFDCELQLSCYLLLYSMTLLIIPDNNKKTNLTSLNDDSSTFSNKSKMRKKNEFYHLHQHRQSQSK